MGGVAVKTSHPFLLYRDGDGQERVLSLEPGMTEASVGRLPSSDLVLDWDSQVSRRHAKLERTRDTWTVVDQGFSTNGTFVNGERVTGRRPLRDGDAISLGATTVIYRSPGAQVEAADAAEVPTEIDLSTTQRRVLAALCRPYKGGNVFATPPTDEEIAAELFLSPGAVKTHVGVLVAKFGLEDVPEDQRRVRLAERAIKTRAITDRDL
jgi:FHA domain-containing protein